MTALPAHVARYCARVDAHLPTLANDAVRRAFLKGQEERWINLYSAFTTNVIAGGPVDPDLDAADYVLTIAEIGQRARKLELEPA